MATKNATISQRLWKLWGVPLAINTGDGIFALARLQLSHLRARGVPAETIIELSARLDATCIELCEGQHLDMRFEGRQDVTVAMYLDMIGRKTAALMDCAARMGSLIGAPENETLSAQLGAFGRALGIGFQLRDDMLGIWSAQALGKSKAGDLRHKKMSLPVISALEDATPADRRTLIDIYSQPGPASEAQIATCSRYSNAVASRERTRTMLREQCDQARALLDSACANTSAADACAALGTSCSISSPPKGSKPLAGPVAGVFTNSGDETFVYSMDSNPDGTRCFVSRSPARLAPSGKMATSLDPNRTPCYAITTAHRFLWRTQTSDKRSWATQPTSSACASAAPHH